MLRINPLPINLPYLNFHPLEVVSRYLDPQLQVGGNCLYLFNNILKMCSLNKLSYIIKMLLIVHATRNASL